MTAAHKKTLLIIIIAVVLLAAAFAASLFFVDMLPNLSYKVSVSRDNGSSIRVEMNIGVPLYCDKEEVFLFLGEKDISVVNCTDTFGNIKETFISEEGIVTVPVSRASNTKIVYDASVAIAGKHGNRGAITNNYAVFDGDQAFLLPAEFYVYDEEGVRNAASSIEFAFETPEGWEQIVPFTRVDNPEWMDIYKITKNAFTFGAFDRLLSDESGLEVFTLSGREPTDTSGFSDIYGYYSGLFGSKPDKFSIILLPQGESSDAVIGGSGTDTVAASFDTASKRDWQLLSHRLFHTFYDNAAPYMRAHIAPNLWLIEGLSTYYENISTDSLPNRLKERLGINTNRQMAVTFDQYLYMRFKEPFKYNFAPMDEEMLTSSAMTEFLHYTSAPLVVKAIEDGSLKNGNEPDALLKYCLNEAAFTDGFAAITGAMELLGDGGADFCDRYLLGLEIIPLWDLRQYQPPTSDILDALNYIETLLANWQQTEGNDYPADIVSSDELSSMMESINSGNIPVMSAEVNAQIKEYCPELYSIVKDYYARAETLGYELNDRDLREKMMAP